MKILLKWLIGIGVFMLIGTAGASDFNNLTFGQVVLQLFVSFAFIGLGYFGLGFTKVRRKQVRKRRKTKYPQVA